MYLYNITFVIPKVEVSSFEKWLKAKEFYFIENSYEVKVLKILTEVDENLSNYSLQISLPDAVGFENFRDSEFENLINESSGIFGTDVLFFDTLLEKI